VKYLALDVDAYLKEESAWGFECLEIDQSIYSNPSMFRLPNSYYPKYGTYKIELTHQEAINLSEDELRKLARKPRPPLYDTDIFLSYEPIDDAVQWYKELKADFDEHEAESAYIPVYDEAIKMMGGISF